jgi:hypothetical protein
MKSNQTATVDVSTLGSDLDSHLILIPSQQLGTKSLKMRLETHAFPDACVSRRISPYHICRGISTTGA